MLHMRLRSHTLVGQCMHCLVKPGPASFVTLCRCLKEWSAQPRHNTEVCRSMRYLPQCSSFGGTQVPHKGQEYHCLTRSLLLHA